MTGRVRVTGRQRDSFRIILKSMMMDQMDISQIKRKHKRRAEKNEKEKKRRKMILQRVSFLAVIP